MLYIFERRRIAKNQTDRRGEIEKTENRNYYFVDVDEEEEGDSNGEAENK